MSQQTYVTDHAMQRCQEREILPQILNTIIKKGKSYALPQGRVLHKLSNGAVTHQNGKQFNLVVITDASEKVIITTWKQEPRKQIAKSRPNQSLKRFHLPQNQLFGEFSKEDWEKLA